MLKQLLLLYAVLVLTTASPQYYRQHYQFEQQSESYKNNELQHKNEEKGRYSKFQDGSSAPIERSAYHQSEYHAPGTEDDTKTRLGSTVHDSNAQRYQQQSAFRTHNSGLGSSDSGLLRSQSLSRDSSVGSATQGHTFGTTQTGRKLHLQTSNSGNLRVGSPVPEQAPAVPTSFRREWSHQSSYGINSQGSDQPERGQGYVAQPTQYGHRHQGIDSAGESSVSRITTQQKEERQRYESRHLGQQDLTQEKDQFGRIETGGTKDFEHQGQYGQGYGQNYEKTYTQQHQVKYDDKTKILDSQPTGTVFYTRPFNTNTAPHNSEQLPQSYKRLTGSNSASLTKLGSNIHTDDNTKDQVILVPSIQSPGSRTLSHQTTRTYAVSNSNPNGQLIPDDTKIYIPQNKLSRVTLNPVSQLSGSDQITQQAETSRRYIISQSTGTNTNKQYLDTDDTSKQFDTQAAPLTTYSGVRLVPVSTPQLSDSDKITHQSSRTYTNSQSKISENIPNSQINRNYDGSRRLHLQSATGPASYPENIRNYPIISTTTEKIKPMYDKPKMFAPTDEILGHQQNIYPIQKPTQHPTNQQQSRTDYQSSGYSRTHSTRNEQNQEKVENIPQQNTDDYDESAQKTQVFHELTQQTQNGYDNLEIGAPQTKDDFDDLTQQKQDRFDWEQKQKKTKFIQIKPEYELKNLDKPTNNDQQDKLYTSRQTQRTYQKQSRTEKTEFAEEPQETPKIKPSNNWKIVRSQPQEDKIQPLENQRDDYSQLVQPGYRKLTKDQDLNQHQTHSKFELTQQHEEVFEGQQHEDEVKHFEFSTQKPDRVGRIHQQLHITQQPQDGFGKIVTGNQNQQGSEKYDKFIIKQGHGQFGQKYEDLSKKHDDVESSANTDKKAHDTSYSSSSSYSKSSSYSNQHEPQSQVIYSPVHVGTQPGQVKVYQTMHIPAGTSEEMRRKLEEQLRQQLELKMQELHSQQQSSHITYSPVRIGSHSGTGQVQLYQTMQIPAGASEQLKQQLEEQLRQNLEQKMQEIQMQQGHQSYRHISTKPLLIHSQSTGEGFNPDCDDQSTGSFSSSYSTSSGSVGANQYKLQLTPGSTVSSSGSSYSMSQQIKQPRGHSYFRMSS